MIRRAFGAMLPLAVSAMVVGCSVGYEGEGQEALEDLDKTEQAVAACEGDDVKYDFNAFAASLAVAVANELGRWDSTADFEVRSGKLELSATGLLRCNGGCNNIKALLRLQDDAASSVPNHSPSIYRSKLTTWHGQQAQKLNSLVNQMLYVDKGIFRFKARHSNKYMAVDGGSYSDNAKIEQKSSVTQAGADQWRVVLEGTTHRFINVRSGKCLDLIVDRFDEWTQLVQRTCSASTSQKFDLGMVESNFVIRTKYLKVVDVTNGSTAEDALVMQYNWNGASVNQQWIFEEYGSGAHIGPAAVATAVYTLTARHSGKTLGIENGSLANGALIEQGTYNPSDDRYHWYVIRNGDSYQLVNRRSGKCMGLLTDNMASSIAQQACDSSNAGQKFWFNPTGDGHKIIYTKFGKMFDVQGASTADGANVTQWGDNWDHHRQFAFKPIIAGEPHRLTFAYKTNDATCGEYNYWYNIVKPNGQKLDFPQDTFVQLMFAGGKQTATGTDINPFIAQQMSGNLVAIDPTAGLNEGGTTTSGSCAVACTKYSATNVAGTCCSCNGLVKQYVKSTFSSSMYLCTGI